MTPPPPPTTSKSTTTASSGTSLADYAAGEMTIEQFASCIAKPGALAAMHKQYRKLIAQDPVDQPCLAQTANPSCDRYNDIKCYDHSRVVLRQLSPDTPLSRDYIHANWMDGIGDDQRRRFICCQGPIDETIGDFWHMVWQENVCVIVTLTRLGGPKCVTYVPTAQRETMRLGRLTVENLGVVHEKDYDAMSIDLMLELPPDSKSSAKQIVHRRLLILMWHSWPDKGTPISSTGLLNLLKQMQRNQTHLQKLNSDRNALVGRGSSGSPIVVHCSAGVGRTGTLVALDMVCTQMELSHANGQVTFDLYNTVLRMRRSRGLMVQRPEQYVFLHMAVLERAMRKQCVRILRRSSTQYRSYVAASTVNMKQFTVKASEEHRQRDEKKK